MPTRSPREAVPVIFCTNKLSLTELWRLGRGPITFLLLLQAKIFDQPTFERKQSHSFAPILAGPEAVPESFATRFAADRNELEALGFRLLGIDREMADVGGCGAYFVAGEILGTLMISQWFHYWVFVSFPAGRLPLATASGYSFLDNRPLFDMLLMRGASVTNLLERHRARLAGLSLPALSDEDTLAELEEITVRVYEYNIKRGVFVLDK